MSNSPAVTTEPFPSLAALRAAHNELLKRVRDSANLNDYLGDVISFLQRGTAAGALIEAEDDRMTGQSLLDYWSAMLYRTGHEPPDTTLADFDTQTEPNLDDALCPYIGLDPFNQQQHALFFGRRRLVDELVEKLANQRLLALVGPSGSGKSSVVRAGLLPALQAGALTGSEEWRYFPIILPGSEPLTQLAQVLEKRWAPRYADKRAVDPIANLDRLLDSAEDDQAQIELLQNDPGHLVRAFEETGDAPVVLVIDQFEELFSLCPDEAIRAAFIANLVALAESPGARHTVILTIRGEYEHFIARTPAFQALFEKSRFQILPLNAAELRETIEKPADLIGLKFEPNVVDALIQDMLGEPAALPLLQFTLLKLWEHRDHRRITWEAYRAIGGGRQALAHSADEFYGSLAPDEQVTVRRILLRMARLGRGLELTNIRIRRATLYEIGEPPEQINRVLEKLLAARLVRLVESARLSDVQIEIAHEALIRNWPTLVNWLEEQRAALEARRRLDAKADEWRLLGRGSAGLLDAVQVAEAERWLASSDAQEMGYDEALPELVQASRTAIEQAENERAAIAQRELEQTRELLEAQEFRTRAERQRAEEAERARQRQRWALIAIATMFVLALMAAAWALQSASVARTQEAKAQQEADARATEAIALQTAQALAVQNAEEARQNEAAAIAAGATAQAARDAAESSRATAETARAQAEHQERQARAGQLAAQAQAAGIVHPQLAVLLGIEALNVSLAAGETPIPIADQTLRYVLTEVTGRGLSGHTARVNAVAFDANSQRLITASADNTVRLWELGNLSAAPRILDNTVPVTYMALSPDGQLCITAGADSMARAWDLTNTSGSARQLSVSGTITALAISANGQRLAISSDDGSVHVWELSNLDGPPRIFRPRTSASPVGSVALSVDGRWLLTGSEDGIARLYDLNGRDPVSPRQTSDRRGALTALAFSLDGKWMLIGSADGVSHLWGLNANGFGSGPFVLRGHTQAITTVAISPDSTLAVTGSFDGTTYLWNMVARQDPSARSVLRGHTAAITSLRTTPDNRTLITTSVDGTAGVWDLTAEDTGATERVLRGHDGPVRMGAISPDGAFLATGSDDTTVRLWDLGASAPTADTLPAASNELITLGCQVAGRTLTEAEWAQYMPSDEVYAPTCGR